jgi:RNA polymerase sigma factor (sigma-70 family)
MTDSQLLIGIIENEERAWRHIYHNMRIGFASILVQEFTDGKLRKEDIEDIFQESLIVLMRKVKSNGLIIPREGVIFSYLVEIGKRTACNFLRKRSHISSADVVTILAKQHYNSEDNDMAAEEKQQTQNDFLDRVFDSMPAECRQLLKLFYWERKPMDDIASILGMRNADSAKTKKSKCMNKFKDIAAQLIESDEFAEDAVRAAVERAALRELLEEERFYAENGISLAALDIEENKKDK